MWQLPGMAWYAVTLTCMLQHMTVTKHCIIETYVLKGRQNTS